MDQRGVGPKNINIIVLRSVLITDLCWLQALEKHWCLIWCITTIYYQTYRDYIIYCTNFSSGPTAPNHKRHGIIHLVLARHSPESLTFLTPRYVHQGVRNISLISFLVFRNIRSPAVIAVMSVPVVLRLAVNPLYHVWNLLLLMNSSNVLSLVAM